MEISFSLPVRPIKWLTVREADGGLEWYFKLTHYPGRFSCYHNVNYKKKVSADKTSNN